MAKKKKRIDPFKVKKSSGKYKPFPPRESQVYAELTADEIIAKAKRIMEINRFFEEVRPFYRERDELTMQLLNMRDHDLLTKNGVQVIDLMADKITAFKQAVFNRYEIKWRG